MRGHPDVGEPAEFARGAGRTHRRDGAARSEPRPGPGSERHRGSARFGQQALDLVDSQGEYGPGDMVADLTADVTAAGLATNYWISLMASVITAGPGRSWGYEALSTTARSRGRTSARCVPQVGAAPDDTLGAPAPRPTGDGGIPVGAFPTPPVTGRCSVQGRPGGSTIEFSAAGHAVLRGE
jgi:hypothetical protein